MYWSIYDTLLLVTGIIVLVIAVLPQKGIPAKTRLWSGIIGGGLVLLALFLGSLRSFRYPSYVYVAPVVALLALGGVVFDARRRTNPDQAGLPIDLRASGPFLERLSDVPDEEGADKLDPAPLPQPAPEAVPVALAEASLAESADPPTSLVTPADDARATAWNEVNDDATSADRLAEIAAEYPEFGPRMLDHPHVYPALREWIGQLPGAGSLAPRDATRGGQVRDD